MQQAAVQELAGFLIICSATQRLVVLVLVPEEGAQAPEGILRSLVPSLRRGCGSTHVMCHAGTVHKPIPLSLFQGGTSGCPCFALVCMTTPVVSALKSYYFYIQIFLAVPAGVLNHFQIRVAVPKVKRPSRGGLRTETVTNI